MTYFLGIIFQLLVFVVEEILCSNTVRIPQINIPSENLLVQIGRKVLLECHVQGAMPINVTWIKKGKYVKENKHYELKTIAGEGNINTHQLWISVIDSDVFGDYTCMASNFYGHQKRIITLREDESSRIGGRAHQTRNGVKLTRTEQHIYQIITTVTLLIIVLICV